jgi:hypothetical protein
MKDTGTYRQPKEEPVPNVDGYPQKTRGTGAATKGTGHSKKMG